MVAHDWSAQNPGANPAQATCPGPGLARTGRNSAIVARFACSRETLSSKSSLSSLLLPSIRQLGDPVRDHYISCHIMLLVQRVDSVLYCV